MKLQLLTMTNETQQKYAREYYLKNREKFLEREKEWRTKNPQKN